MARRKPKISLAPVNLKPSADAYGKATGALVHFHAEGYRRPDGPTPERLVRAQGGARVETFFEVVEVADGDTFRATPVKFARIKIADAPFDRLKHRGQLAPNDQGLNNILGKAGDEYRSYWDSAGLEPISAIDPTREPGGGSGVFGLFGSEAAAQAFAVYSAARAAVASDFRDPLDAIVLYDRDPFDVGRRYSAYSSEKQAVACALHDVRRGLVALAKHFGLLADESLCKWRK